jgi:hypothetical protein
MLNHNTIISNILFILGGAVNVYRREQLCIKSSGKPEGKRKLGRPRRRWRDNISMSLCAEIGVAWTRLTWLKLGIN